MICREYKMRNMGCGAHYTVGPVCKSWLGVGGQIGPEASTLNLSVKESKRFGTEMRKKTVEINWGAVEAKSGLSMEMEEILDIVDLDAEDIWDIVEYIVDCCESEERRIFLGKWEKCCDLSGDLLLMQGGVYLPAIYSATTFYTLWYIKYTLYFAYFVYLIFHTFSCEMKKLSVDLRLMRGGGSVPSCNSATTFYTLK